MTAKAHGLDEFIKPLETTLIDSDEYDHERIFKSAEKFVGNQTNRPKALIPLRPVFTTNESLQQSAWPMINLRAKEAERAAQMFKRKKADMFEANDDMFFDAKEYHVANKNVANILSTQGAVKDEKDTTEAIEKDEEAQLEDLDGAWGDEEEGIDIDMPEDLMEDTKGTGDPLIDADANIDSDIFVPPSEGPDALKQALKKNP